MSTILVLTRSTRSHFHNKNLAAVSSFHFTTSVQSAKLQLQKTGGSHKKESRKQRMITLIERSLAPVTGTKECFHSSPLIKNRKLISKMMKRPRDTSPIKLPGRVMKVAKTSAACCPNDFLLSFSKAKVISSFELENFFHSYSESEREAYGFEVMNAVRSRNMEKLNELLKQGQIFQCSNRFGESIIHMACRHGSYEVVKFLIEQAKVSIVVQDDYGRNPLHDAFWTVSPNIELVDLLVKECPSLLFLTDVRGFTPLQYARAEHHVRWIEFLTERESLILKGLADLESRLPKL